MKLATIKSEGLAHKSYYLSDGYEAVVIREPHEWQEGTIEGAETVFFGDLGDKASSLLKNKPFAVICSAGNRSSIGAGILDQKGFKDIYNVLGGMMAWQALDYPMKV